MALADVQRAEAERDRAFQEKRTALGGIDDANAQNARLHQELTDLREALPEIDQALAAMARHRRCGCRDGGGA